MMRKQRGLFARVRLFVLLTLVLILPSVGMAQDHHNGLEKEDLSPAPAQPGADRAKNASPAQPQSGPNTADDTAKANELKQASGKLLFNIDTSSTITVRGEYLDEFEENPGYLKVSDTGEEVSDDTAHYTNGEDFDDVDWKMAGVDDAYNDSQALSFSAKYERDLSNQSGFELAYGIRNTESEGPPSYNASGGFGSSDVTNHNLVGIYNHGFDLLRSKLIAGIDLLHSQSDSTTYGGRSVESDIDQQFSYQKGSWKLWAHVLNLLDEKYAERVSYSSSSMERSYTSGEPLNAYVGLSYTFN